MTEHSEIAFVDDAALASTGDTAQPETKAARARQLPHRRELAAARASSSSSAISRPQKR